MNESQKIQLTKTFNLMKFSLKKITFNDTNCTFFKIIINTPGSRADHLGWRTQAAWAKTNFEPWGFPWSGSKAEDYNDQYLCLKQKFTHSNVVRQIKNVQEKISSIWCGKAGRNFRNLQKFPRTASARPRLFSCLDYAILDCKVSVWPMQLVGYTVGGAWRRVTSRCST